MATFWARVLGRRGGHSQPNKSSRPPIWTFVYTHIFLPKPRDTTDFGKLLQLVWNVSPSDVELHRLADILRKITAPGQTSPARVARQATQLALLRFASHSDRPSQFWLDLTPLRPFLRRAELSPSDLHHERLLSPAVRVISRQASQAATDAVTKRPFQTMLAAGSVGRPAVPPVPSIRTATAQRPPPNLPESQVGPWMNWRSVIEPTQTQLARYYGGGAVQASNNNHCDSACNQRRAITAGLPPPYSVRAESSSSAMAGPPMDPLVAAHLHNLNASALCRLPDHLLLGVMHYVAATDALDLFCLRQTSRIFLRLFSADTAFSPLHAPPTAFGPDLVWRAQAPVSDRRAAARVRDRIHDTATQLCVDCRAVRADLVADSARRRGWFAWHFMHCAGCGCDHPLALFSGAQQQAERDGRICRGREGRVRLCAHEAVSWGQVAGMVDVLDGAANHAEGATKVVCRHPSHLPQHRGSKAGEEDDESVHPTFSVRRGDRDCPWDDVVAMLSWTAHLCLDDLAPEAHPVSAEAFRLAVDELRKGCGEFLAPETFPGVLQEMRCADPNLCTCLDWRVGASGPEWPGVVSDGEGLSSCRRRTGQGAGLHALRPTTGGCSPASSAYGTEKSAAEKGEFVNSSLCQNVHTVRRVLYSRFSDSNFIQVSLLPCDYDHRQGGQEEEGGEEEEEEEEERNSRRATTRCVRVRYERQIQLREGSRRQSQRRVDSTAGVAFNCVRLGTVRADCLRGIPWGWYQAVECDKTDACINDLGVGWCRNRGCRNFCGYAREYPLRGAQKMNHHCPLGCSRPLVLPCEDHDDRDGEIHSQREETHIQRPGAWLSYYRNCWRFAKLEDPRSEALYLSLPPSAKWIQTLFEV